ncbi:hypothetical protein ARMGADRAFT_1022689 [Armillaria gallica]|uniref:Uncharacterized protein n=1 Tax=Armillaria gallica TaxID=47427 RepID=A0A2H3EDW7_ARMGA|nr:hypothetical protein ARMGADRAFT_1022689 [Armillaria gallica]
MSMMMTSQVLPFKLEADEKFNGENWASWEMLMIAEGGPHGLVNYWENKVSPQLPNLLPLPATGLTSLTPLDHEYAQHPFGFGLDPRGKAHEAWNKLQTEYGAHSDII